MWDCKAILEKAREADRTDIYIKTMRFPVEFPTGFTLVHTHTNFMVFLEQLTAIQCKTPSSWTPNFPHLYTILL
jgi:hypothetical protein